MDKTRYLLNNLSKLGFYAIFFLLNVALYVVAAKNYWDAGAWMITARTAGLSLDVTSLLIVMLMMRGFLYILRLSSISTYLPIDHHIGFHKLVGIFIMITSLQHTIGHVGRYCKSFVVIGLYRR